MRAGGGRGTPGGCWAQSSHRASSGRRENEPNGRAVGQTAAALSMDRFDQAQRAGIEAADRFSHQIGPGPDQLDQRDPDPGQLDRRGPELDQIEQDRTDIGKAGPLRAFVLV